jgi:adenylate cyclase
MQFRIGVNLGDVIEEESRIYGDGVNIAARLESLADPGGICVSKTAFDQIETKLPFGYEYLGEQSVKNIAKAVGAYRVLMEPRVTVAGAKPPKVSFWRHKTVIAGAMVVLVAIIGVGVWNFYLRAPTIEPASKEKMALPLPDLPSIAVLPFVNMSEDPKQEFLCDGITENIITALSKVPRLFVIARNSTFAYKGKPVKVKQVSEELGVQYVLEGSVQRSSDRIRVTAQLIDALKGHHVWAERYDRDLKDLFALQDEITVKILNAIRVKLTERGLSSGAVPYDGGKQDLDCLLKYMEAQGHIQRANIEDNNMARRIAEEAIATCPEPQKPYALMATFHMMDYLLGTTKSPRETIEKAIKLAQKSLSVDDSRAEDHAKLGFLYCLGKEWDKAITEGERGIAINPSGADVQHWYAATLTFAGRPEEAILLFEKAIRLNPFGPSRYFMGYGHALRDTGRFQEAVSAYKKAIKREPNNFLAHLNLAATYSMMGLEKEAQSEAEEVRRLNPKFSVDYFAKVSVYRDQTVTNNIINALRKTGLPDKPPLPLPEKPSIAVLPFVNMSDDLKQEFFSDGISEDIINALVRWPPILVIPRASSFIYKGKSVDVKQVGREMGVRYALEGSVRREGNRVRITVQLIDTTTLQHLFSERYEREMKDIFAIQDDITMKVLTAMQVSLYGFGTQLLPVKGTKNIEAYVKILEADVHNQIMNRSSLAQARQLAEEAITLDSEYGRACSMLASAIGNEFLLGVYEKNPREALERAMALAEKAVQIDDSSSYARRILGFMAFLNRDYEKAIAELERAIALEPNTVAAHYSLGYFLYSAGRTEEAIPILKKGVALSPIPLPRALSHLCIASRKAGRYEEAVAVCKQLLQREPNHVLGHLTLGATYVEMERMEDARAEIAEVLRVDPKYTVKVVPRSFPWKDQAEIDLLIDSLRKAGLPDKPPQAQP